MCEFKVKKTKTMPELIVKKKYKYYKKLSKDAIQNKFKNNQWSNKKKQAFLAHQAKIHNVEAAKINAMFDKSTARWLVAMCINYCVNSDNTEGFIAIEQIAYICNTSYKNVEFVVRKLTKNNVIKHEINTERKNNLKKYTKTKTLCNPFKWIFRYIKNITHKLLQSLRFNKIEFIAAVKGFIKPKDRRKYAT
jgi:predicted transcriptional regulator